MDITNYLFTVRDAWRGLVYIATHFTRRDVTRLLLFGLAFWLSYFVWHASWESVFFILFGISLFLWHIDGCISIGAGVGCLVVILILQILAQTLVLPQGAIWSETVAVWAYYFLAIGVVKQIGELIADSRKQNGDGNK